MPKLSAAQRRVVEKMLADANLLLRADYKWGGGHTYYLNSDTIDSRVKANVAKALLGYKGLLVCVGRSKKWPPWYVYRLNRALAEAVCQN